MGIDLFRHPKVLLLLSFLLPGVVYFLTLSPSISSGDSAELITNSYQLGLMHPPGYPLYTGLAKLFTYLPWGSVAWRVNLFSAVAGSFAVLFLYLSLTLISSQRLMSFLLAMLYAFSPLVWRYSVVAEVFALNQLFIALLLFLCLLIWQRAKADYLPLLFLAMGLSLSHQHTSIFVIIPLGLWVMYFLRAKVTFNLFLQSALGLLIGLFPYLLLFTLGLDGAPLTWGHLGSINDFFRHVLRMDYGTFSLGPQFSGSYYWSNIGAMFSSFQRESLYLLLPLGLISLWRIWKNPGVRTYGLLVLLILAFYILVFHWLAEVNIADPVYFGVLQRFWLLPYFLLFVFAAWSLQGIKRQRLFNYLLLVICVLQLIFNYKKSDHSQDWLYRDFAQSVLDAVEPNGVLLAYGDLDVFTTNYLQSCEGVREDVSLISQARLTYPWYLDMLKVKFPDLAIPTTDIFPEKRVAWFVEKNAAEIPIYTALRNPKIEESWRSNYYELPLGFINKLIPSVAIPELESYLQVSDSLWTDKSWIPLAMERGQDWDIHLLQRYLDSEYRRLNFISENYSNLSNGQKESLRNLALQLKKAFSNDPKINDILRKLQE